MPWTRTLTALASMSRLPMTSIVWTFICSALAIFALIVVAARVELGADHVGAQFGLNGAGVFDERGFVADGEDAHLIGREPEREVAGVMLDEEADEPLVRAERRAMDAERRLVRVVLVAVDEAEAGRARRSPPGWWRW